VADTKKESRERHGKDDYEHVYTFEQHIFINVSLYYIIIKAIQNTNCKNIQKNINVEISFCRLTITEQNKKFNIII